MKLGQDIHLRNLRTQAKLATKHYSMADIHAMTERYHTEVWFAVRLICEALLGEEDDS